MSCPFPFRDHFTMRQVRVVEGLREKFTDQQIWLHCTRIVGLSASQLIQYFKRNPRRPREAA